MPTTRRRFQSDLAKAIAAATLAALVRPSAARARGLGREVRDAIALLQDSNARLRRGTVDAAAWQADVEIVLASVPLAELVAALDLTRARERLRLPSDRAGSRALRVPAVGRRGGAGRVDAALFGFREGRAIPPHAHNNVAAVHLVLDGELRVRTFDRVRDEDRALVLAPRRDVLLGRGDVLSVSDDVENAHWLSAVSPRAHTFDIPLARVRAAAKYAIRAEHEGMIFLDPDRAEPEGTHLRVPVIDAASSVARYGHRPANRVRVSPKVPERVVAVTVDDLPWVGPREGTIGERLRDLAAQLTSREVPAYGFVTGGKPGLAHVRAWTDAGLRLGNHSYSHERFSQRSLEEMLADFARCDDVVKETLGVDISREWLRYPFLDHGHTPQKVRGMAPALRGRKGIAHVSLDTADYLIARAYPRAKDRDAVAAIYVEHVLDCAAHFESLSRRLYGREIPLVLLMHANQLNAERAGEVLDALAARGYRFASLDEVCRDAVYETYRVRPPLVPREGDRSLLNQVALARGLIVEDRASEAWFRARFSARLDALTP
jgi:peptidoglycan/xylan/chitin deacetylase (PgdA/CDA1 family)